MQWHYLKDLVENKVVRITYIKTENQIMDILNKLFTKEEVQETKMCVCLWCYEPIPFPNWTFSEMLCHLETIRNSFMLLWHNLLA
jgi:hypothetical protein